jgi:hypothetical protein
MATTTWSRRCDGSLEHVSRYYVSKRLKITRTTLGRWIKNKHRILALRRGAQRLRLSRVGRHLDLERKLNMEFENARSRGRQITYRWFLRYVCSPTWSLVLTSFRHARTVYRELFPHSCIQAENGRWIITGFKFSNRWFTGFLSRYSISLRYKTKRAQQSPENLYSTIQSWL